MRRKVLYLIFAWVTLTGLARQAAYAQADLPATTDVVAVGITVGDLERSIGFYRDILDFELVSARELPGPVPKGNAVPVKSRRATMRLGDEIIELTQYCGEEARKIREDSRSHDRWFQHIAIIVRDMDEAYSRLRQHKVRHASSAPQTLPEWNHAAAGIRAFYFRDIDGHFLEILQFPPGKGNTKWHQPTDRLFLGIDHTAIVVADTERSVRFYEEVAGLRVVGSAENYGTEQEHLNGLFGAHLKITTLRGASGPGVELLEYLFPSDGRDYPADSREQDLWHWEVSLRKHERSAIGDSSEAGLRLVSEGKSSVSNPPCSILRDPDGHAIRFRTDDR